MNCIKLIILIATCSVVSWCQSIEYWVVPHQDYPCPVSQSNISNCQILSDLISTESDSALLNKRLDVLTIHFLPGVHIPRKSGWLAVNKISKVSLEGDSQQQAVINCSDYKIGILLNSISLLNISYLTLRGCGYMSVANPVDSPGESNFRNSSIRLNSIVTLLLFNIELLYIDHLQLVDNVGFGMVSVQSSTSLIINSTFCGPYLHMDAFDRNRGNIFIIVSQKSSMKVQDSLLCNGHGMFEPLAWPGIPRPQYISGGITVWLTNQENSYLYFNNVTFQGNDAHKGGAMYLSSLYSENYGCQGEIIVHIKSCIFINNSASTVGGAIHREHHIFAQCIGFFKTEYSKIFIDSSSFSHNHALIRGGGVNTKILVTLQNGQDNVRAFTLNITNSVFKFNRAAQGAAVFLGLDMYSQVYNELIPIVVNRTLLTDVSFILQGIRFEKNFAVNSGGAIYFKSAENSFDSLINIFLQMKKCNFSRNVADEGSALFLDSRKTHISGTSVFLSECLFAENICLQVQAHSSLSVIHISAVKYLLLEDTIIESNYNCRAVYSGMSLIEIAGKVFIKNHSSSEGAAIHLDCTPLSKTHRTSQLLFNNHVNTILYIINNHAVLYGGGISVKTGCSNPELCFYKLKTNSAPATVIMKNNSAGVAANSIYGGFLEHCVHANYALNFSLFKSVFQISDYNSTPSIVASQPYKACVCTNEPIFNYRCQFEYSVSVFPGQTFQIPVVGASDFSNTFPSVVRALITGSDFVELNEVQKTQQIGLTCKNLSYTISTTVQNVSISMTLQVDQAFRSNQAISQTKNAIVNVYINQCPFGFELNINHTKCLCTKQLQVTTVACDIELHIFRKSFSSIWVGNYSGQIAVHNNCPFDYCKQNFFDVNPYNQQEQCSFNRSGILCGACRPGFSNVLGTSQCKQCSNLYLLLLIPFALAGIALVLILLKCDLTVSSGILNGLVFYVNILQANSVMFFQNPSPAKSFSFVFAVATAWLNLDLGLEVCLSSNLTQYIKTWLQFVFPIYIWVIVGILIIISRYSITISKFFGSNTVSVLATLFLLSYAKVLRTTLCSFSGTAIQLSNTLHIVWLLDGSYTFAGWPHILLFLFALLMILLYIIPLTVLLLLAPLLQSASHYRLMTWVNMIAPLIAAYHKPYKKKYRFWTGLMLLVRFVLIVLFAANSLGNPGLNALLTILVSSTLLSVWWKIGKIYKKAINNFLEIFFLLNLIFISTVALYFHKVTESIHIKDVLISIAVGIALVVFTLTVLHHCILTFSKSRIGRRCISIVKNSGKRHETELEDTAIDNDSFKQVTVSAPTCTVVDIREIAEPLLQNNNN